jgi:hypothetical protein
VLGPLILSLGDQPLSNALLVNLDTPTNFYPLDFRICYNCGLGQIGEYVPSSEIFTEYTYLSSTSAYWLKHAKNYSREVKDRFSLQRGDLVLEVASNDGYLLQYFQEMGCKVLGVEPAENVADIARAKKIPTDCEFFGLAYARELISSKKIPKLVVANNVLAHVPDINDFVGGLALLAKAGAIISIEAPSMKVMLEKNLFDTIYHEHFSYISATAVKYLTDRHGIQLFDIEFLETHGGSNRFWLGVSQEISNSVLPAIEKEERFGLKQIEVHQEFARKSNLAIEGFKKWCSERQGHTIGYGAAAKATVLLNAAKVNSNEIGTVFDNSKSKQGKFIPGPRIVITSPNELELAEATEMVIFPWNIAAEIVDSVRRDFPSFGGRFWIALPEMAEIN